jgi:multidrug efflux pump subunit AcrA (membrane-fusion protein)
MKTVLKPGRVAWALGALVAAILVNVVVHSGAKASVQPPSSPVVEVATVEQRNIPVYGEWIGTLTGQVNADVKTQVTGYLLTRKYKEGSYVKKGQLLFEIDPRPFQTALDQAKGQLAQAQAQLIQDQAQLATAKANQLKSQLDVEKYDPLSKADAVSKQDFDNATQMNLANQAQVQAAEGYEQSIQRAFGDVSDALIGYDKYHVVREREEQSVSVFLMRYRDGTSNYLEVFDNQRSQFNAELTLAHARNNEYQSLVQLYKALGGGWK